MKKSKSVSTAAEKREVTFAISAAGMVGFGNAAGGVEGYL